MASVSVALGLAKRPGIRRLLSIPSVVFANRSTHQSVPVTVSAVLGSVTNVRRDIKARRLSLLVGTSRIRKSVTATRIAVARATTIPKKRVQFGTFQTTTTATVRMLKRSQLRIRSSISSVVAFLAERATAQIYPLSYGIRHLANAWRGRLQHKAIPMEKLWTTVEKRTSEVLDLAVDWTDILNARGEVAIATAVWSIDPAYPGDAVLAGVPYQPRLEGNVAKARVAVGNTSDTMFRCTVTFRSGQVEVDKTLVKWIP